MMLLHDRATMTHALTLDLDPQLHRLLADRIAALTLDEQDLTDWTEILIVQAGDTEADILREVGFSPLVEPIDGVRFPQPDFQPYWDWLAPHGGWYEMIVTFGSTFAYVLLIENAPGASLIELCRSYSR